MKIDDEVIKRMCDAFEKVFEDADYQTREPISPMARQVAEDAMHSAAAVLQRLHEEELERVLGPVTNEEGSAFFRTYISVDTGSIDGDRRHALGAFLASRRALIAPEPTLREKVLAVFEHRVPEFAREQIADEILALLEPKP